MKVKLLPVLLLLLHNFLWGFEGELKFIVVNPTSSSSKAFNLTVSTNEYAWTIIKTLTK